MNVFMKKYYIKTYGCQMNTYDSSKINDLLKTYKNMLKTTDIYKADILILNTLYISCHGVPDSF